MKDEDAKKIGLGILQVLADALGGEVRRDQRQHAAEQQVWREDVEQNATRAEQAEAKLAHIARDWRRIEELIGREFTSPESTIDRVAFLAEQERQLSDIVKTQHEKEVRLIAERDDLRELYETEQRRRKEAEYRLVTLVELRKRAKDVLANDGDLLDETRRVRLERACRWTETPAEGAARLRVE